MANTIIANRTTDPDGVFWTCIATLDTLTASLPDAETIVPTGCFIQPLTLSLGASLGSAVAMNLSMTNGAGVEFGRFGCTSGGASGQIPFHMPQVNGAIFAPVTLAGSSTPTVSATFQYKYLSGTAPVVT